MNYFNKFIYTMISTLALNSSIYAGESELYDLAPENSAFIRIINAEEHTPDVTIGNTLLPAAKTCSAGNYIYLPGGQHTLTALGKSWQYTLQSNIAYSLIITKGQHTLMAREIFSDKRRALLEVYNLTPEKDISIKTTLNKKPVFNNVSTLSHDARPINPLRIELSGYNRDIKLFDAKPVIFQSGRSSSLFICQLNDQYVTNWSQQ